MGFGSKWRILNGHVDHIENSKLNIADMWLISLDLCHKCVYNFLGLFSSFLPVARGYVARQKTKPLFDRAARQQKFVGRFLAEIEVMGLEFSQVSQLYLCSYQHRLTQVTHVVTGTWCCQKIKSISCTAWCCGNEKECPLFTRVTLYTVSVESLICAPHFDWKCTWALIDAFYTTLFREDFQS